MSRGPGKWQRVILEALEIEPAWYLRTLLPLDASRSDYVALLRAANALWRSGRIWKHDQHLWSGEPGRVVIRRVGCFVTSSKQVASLNFEDGVNEYGQPIRKARKLLNVDECPKRNLINT